MWPATIRGTRWIRAELHAVRAATLALGLALIIGLGAGPGPARAQAPVSGAGASPAAAPGGDPAAGRTAYAQSGCSVCHGAEGGGTTAGPSLTQAALTSDAFVAFVRRPVRSMPAYPADVISDRVLADMFAYLAQAAAAALPAGQATRGAELFVATGCFQCHANQAQGGMHGPRIGPDPISWPRFAWYVRHPSATMPPYTEEVLPDAALRDVYAFLEALPQPPDPSRIPLLAP
jgi:mono/diheme cytochrome c family protein